MNCSLIRSGIVRTLAGLFLMLLAAQAGRAADTLRTAAPDTGSILRRIIITGNNHTNEIVITREMELQPGRTITSEALAFDRGRIYSLGLFNDVRLHVLPADTGNGFADLLVEVHERWYIFPYPVLGLRDRDWSKIYYGLGLFHSNFRGMNEKVNLVAVFGYDPSFGLSYRTPFLTSSGNSFMETRVAYSTVRNKSILLGDGVPQFDEKHIAGYLTFGRRFGITQTAWLTGGFESVHVDEYQPGRTLSAAGTDRYPVLSAGYLFDSRDFGDYPSHGSVFRASITKTGWPGAEVDYIRYAGDARRYQPVAGGVLWATRLFADVVAAGPTPDYGHVFFGYGERIRGHYKEVMEGENIAGISSELRFTILPVRYLQVSYLPKEFSIWRFGIAATLFGDAGTVWSRGQPLAVNQFAKGYGAGLNILLPYDIVLRTEYAFNEARHGEFIIDVRTLL